MATVSTSIGSITAEATAIDPRAMAEKFTSSGAEGLLQDARGVFGISFDDKSEIDIYKVWIGPPSEDHLGFFSSNQKWSYALRADQTSWADEIALALAPFEQDLALGTEGAESASRFATSADTILGHWSVAEGVDTEGMSYSELQTHATYTANAGTPYGDSPHMTDTYESYTDFINDPDGYNAAQFSSILQYATLYNWRDTVLSSGVHVDDVELNPEIAMANNTIHIIQPWNTDTSGAPLTNGATTLPLAGDNPLSAAEAGLDVASFSYTGDFLGISDSSTKGTQYQEALRQTWKTPEIVEDAMYAFISEQATKIAETVVSSIDTKFLAKRQRSPPLPSSALTALRPGSKTHATSTYTKQGWDWMGAMLAEIASGD